MLSKKILSALVISVFLIMLGWFAVESSKPEVLPKHSPIPVFAFKDRTGFSTISRNHSEKLIIILFHKKCKYCHYQLKKINDAIEKFIDTKIYLLTTHRHLFDREYINEYPLLASTKGVIWGVADKQSFKHCFGSLATPQIFIFNESGRLTNKIRGEVSIEKLMKCL